MKKPYQPIDCNFYDRIEHAAIRREEITLVFENEAGKLQTFTTYILDTRTMEDGEYVILANKEQIRMDQIKSLNGVLLEDNNCQT